MTHPNPLTATRVEADQKKAHETNTRLVYKLWDDEVRVEVIMGSCMYSFPSCVLVKFSYGNGLTAEAWSPYKRDLGMEKQAYWQELFKWVADAVTTRATSILPDAHPMAPLTQYSEIETFYQ